MFPLVSESSLAKIDHRSFTYSSGGGSRESSPGDTGCMAHDRPKEKNTSLQIAVSSTSIAFLQEIYFIESPPYYKPLQCVS